MIHLCVAKTGKNKFSITTSDMKDKLEAKYLMEQQKESYAARLKPQDAYLQQVYAVETGGIGALAEQQAATTYRGLWKYL